MLYLARDGMNVIRYYVKHTAGFTITPVIVRGAGAGVATWDWGDGSATEVGDNMNHVYAGAGTYTVTLSLVNAQTYLTSIDVNGDCVVGDFLGALRHCRALTNITAHTNAGLNTNCATVNLSGWWPSLVYFYVNSTAVSGDISGWVLPASLVYFHVHTTAVSGDISGWVLPASLVYFYVHTTAVSGDISGWVLPASLIVFLGYATALTGAPDFTSAVALATFRYDNCALPQGDVDANLLGLYNRRASFTNATPTANLGGTNAAPSGVYQDATPPTTGLEYKYKLVVDPDAEGFNKWAITVTA